METAFVMILTLPKSEGGLGIKGIETDYEVQVTAPQKSHETQKFFMDAYLKKSRTDIEYNGFYHDAEEDRAIDESARMHLRPWGTESSPSVVIPLCMPALSLGSWKQSSEKGVRPSRLPKDFQIMQEDLRQFVLRRFIEGKSEFRRSFARIPKSANKSTSKKQCSKASHWTIRRLTRFRQSMTCRLSNPTAHHSTKQVVSRPRAGSSGPETRLTNKVGTLATYKIASIQQSRVPITLEWIQK
ncbi:MAG: hypothetical protein ACLU37_08610 [Collinsella sp.]